MQTFDIVIERNVPRSFRVDSLESIYDCPIKTVEKLEWSVSLPVDEKDWNIGLIVGPSGSGKSTILEKFFGKQSQHLWDDKPIIDELGVDMTMTDVCAVLGSVGLNTIPAWTRPYSVLSTGEKFRADIAHQILENQSVIVLDEFTSVVDRQIGKIVSNSIQKIIRKNNKKLVAASCHYDIIDWLQPDWIYDVAANRLSRRLLQRRPELNVVVGKFEHKDVWPLFSKYHYMSKMLHQNAECFCLCIDDRPVSLAAMLFQPSTYQICKPIKRCSRLVTLPDYQGLGLAMILIEFVAQFYNSKYRTHVTPAHPSLIKTFAKSNKWKMIKKPGVGTSKISKTAVLNTNQRRACAVFEYVNL